MGVYCTCELNFL